MKVIVGIAALVLITTATVAQVASHAPTAAKQPVSTPNLAGDAGLQVLSQPVARVNGAVLTQLDLVRQMFEMFPYAQQHNGFPKDLEPEIRRGALDMIIFNELVYQEAKRRNLTVSPAKLARAEADLRKEFPSREAYQKFLKMEAKGSPQVMRERLRRALLIDALLKAEVTDKARITAAAARAYYDQNPKLFQRAETIHIQSISILPPNQAPETLNEARRRAEGAVKAAKTAKDYQEFGLLAEKMSEDDFRVNMGDHKPRPASELPPEIVNGARMMKPGDVSNLIQLGNAYTIFRLVAHTPAGQIPFEEARKKLQTDLEKEKTERVRAALGQKLRKNANIEKL